MTEKYALFAFNGDPMCFVHVILNALDMIEKGFEVKIIIEGSACKLAPNFEDTSNPFHNLYQKLKDSDTIECFCKACSGKMGTLKKVEEMGFPTCAEMNGHPSIARFIQNGYTIITF